MTTPEILRRWPKDPHTGASGAYYERTPASPRDMEGATAWTGRQMVRWLRANDQMPTDRDAEDAARERDELVRMVALRERELARVNGELGLLQVEYARLRRSAEPAPHAQTEGQWRPSTDRGDSRHSSTHAPKVAPGPTEFKDASELNSNRCKPGHWLKRDALSAARRQWAAGTRYTSYQLTLRRRYVDALRASLFDDCDKECCADRAAIEAELGRYAWSE